MSRYYRSILNIQVAAIDPDAQAFLTAAGIIDATITNAINNLVVGLKGASLWTKMKAIYPFVGGTATTHKFNLKDPRDLDVAYRLTFFGGLTHSINGVEGNGTNGYGDTHLNATNFMQNDLFAAGYSRSAALSGGDTILGAFDASVNGFYISPQFSGNFDTRCQTNSSATTANSNSSGFLGISRTEAASYNQIIRSTLQNKTVASIAPTSARLLILATSLGASNINFARHQMASYYFGDGLTSGEIASLRSLDLTFQTSLSRNV